MILFLFNHDQNGVCNQNIRYFKDMMCSENPAGAKFKCVCVNFTDIALLPKSATTGNINVNFGHTSIVNKFFGKMSPPSPYIIDGGLHWRWDQLHQRRQEDTPPSHRGPPLLRRQQPRALEESEVLGVTECCCPPSIPHVGISPGRRDFSNRLSQYLLHKDSGALIGSRYQDIE